MTTEKKSIIQVWGYPEIEDLTIQENKGPIPQTNTRKPIQIAAFNVGDYDILHALCNDGAIFWFRPGTNEWLPLPPIPQPGDETNKE